MKEQEIIKNILDKMNALFDSPQDFLEQKSKCIKELVDLPIDYSNRLGEYGRNLLQEMSIKDRDLLEVNFIMILYALIDRKEKELAFLLATQALMSPLTEDNYRYVSLLDELDLLGTVTVFIDVLPKLESFDEYGGHAQEKIIEYLIRKNAEYAYEAVKECLFDEADRVRATALQFMNKFDKEGVALYLIKMLEDEDVQYNILLILSMLRKWKIKDALPLLNAQLKEDWVYDDKELYVPFQETITSLSE